eukprot:gnl/TRDRNA2_/TRDRNA2_75628_c0_seq4.p1 gnl/TRDRNA2_/TRDRNA2_75628_c0~~gnl/TRDRNA2_/TRDRNA2_75628_c0_seq4.p1  ORF type:complete len:228 (+),score=29.00 gnl/TRDRNA2_/TRDRNA2_75628_c0_seq4:57-740(+)
MATQMVGAPQTLMQVQVPPGALPGSMIQVAGPTGQIVQVQLPADAVPGSTIQVNVPMPVTMTPGMAMQDKGYEDNPRVTCCYYNERDPRICVCGRDALKCDQPNCYANLATPGGKMICCAATVIPVVLALVLMIVGAMAEAGKNDYCVAIIAPVECATAIEEGCKWKIDSYCKKNPKIVNYTLAECDGECYYDGCRSHGEEKTCIKDRECEWDRRSCHNGQDTELLD